MNPRTLDRLDSLHARLYRWRWWVRVAVAAVVLPWAYRVALPRINAMPARPPGAQNSSPPEPAASSQPDQTQELATILQGLPQVDATNGPLPPAPIGKQWVMTDWPGWRISALQPNESFLEPPNIPDGAPGNLLCGEWLPQARYSQALAIAYLRSPAVHEAIIHIRRVAGHFVDPWRPQQYDVACGVLPLLTAQGRYHIAAEHDVTAAARDMQTILALAAWREATGNLAELSQAQAIRDAVMTEMMYWSREFALSREQADQLITVLDAHRLDLRSRWKEAVRGERVRLEEGLDGSYTRDGQGNGWFVIHRPDPSDSMDKAYCLLNVASLWMTDRAAMVRKIRTYTEAAAAKIDLPYDLAVLQIASIDLNEVYPSPVDGPYVQWSGGVGMRGILWRCIDSLRAEAGVKTSLALSVYRHDHGSFPAQLADLVPVYLPTLPMDPLRNQPLKYEPDAKDGYRLYAVGRGAGRMLAGRESILEHDEMLSKSRPEPHSEFHLRSVADWVVIEGKGAGP